MDTGCINGSRLYYHSTRLNHEPWVMCGKILGLLGYYRKYIQDFSKIVQPLYDLLKTSGVDSGSPAAQRGRCTPKVNRGKIQFGHAITWTHEHQVVLEKLVDYLVNPPFLGYPDYSLPFILHTDASNKGLGVVLYQRKSSEMRVIGYGSRTLNPAEKNYHLHSGKLQFLELKSGICNS